MDCETYTRGGRRLRCKHFDECHRLSCCLCEVEPYDDGTLPPLPKQTRTKKTTWPVRRQQLIEFASQHEVISTATVMAHTNAAQGTTCNWLKRLVNEGELIRLTRAILSGLDSQPATFAIAHREKEQNARHQQCTS